MTGALLLALLVLLRFGLNPAALFAEAARQYGDGVLAPGKLVSNPLDAVSLGMALMFGTAGLPHILMRFYTVPDARAARASVFVATGLIGLFYLLTFVLGFGAMVLVGPDTIRAVDPGGNMAAPLLAELLGGTPFLGFIAAVAFATILAVVAGLTLSGAAALSHDLWVSVVRRGHADAGEQLRVARVATLALGVIAVALGITFKGQNVAFMVSLAFAIAASANFPALILAIFWRGYTTAGAVTSMVAGHGGHPRAHLSVAHPAGGHPRPRGSLVSAQEPGAGDDPAVVRRRHPGVVAGARAVRRCGVCGARAADASGGDR